MTRISSRRWLILPIETKNRELHAKVLLALVAAERGWGVVIGDKTATRLHQQYLPPGTFLEKDINVGSATVFAAARAHGNRVSALCEEGLVYFNAEDYIQRRIDRDSVDLVDYFFVWGKRQSTDVAEVFNDGARTIVPSGNPRFDLLRPEWRGVYSKGVKRITEEYGRIILLNTKFSTVSNTHPDMQDYVAYLTRAGKIQTSSVEKLWQQYVSLNHELFSNFRETLPILAESFPNHTIIVRTHPSEDDAPWQEVSAGLSNVDVVHRGNVHEWIIAADAVIQNNCTTAVESFLLGKPAISYRPSTHTEAEFMLPNKVSIHAHTPTELVTCTRQALDNPGYGERLYAQQGALVREYVANIDGPMACETIMNTLDTLMLPHAPAQFPITRGGASLSVLRKIRRMVSPLYQGPHGYSYKKFPGLSLEEMQDIISSFQSLSSRFSDITVRKVDDNGFCIYRP